MSYQAYQKVQQVNETPTQVELRLFGKVTSALRAILDQPTTDPQVIKALDWNRRMWSTLAADCGVEGNQLPKDTRASIISLSIWVSRHTSSVMRGHAQVQPLIDINQTIMQGLAKQDQLQAEARAQAMPDMASANPIDTAL